MKPLILAIICLCLCTGCNLLRRAPSIKLPTGETVTGPKDAGTPPTINTSDAGTTMAIPAGSTVKVTATEAQPATQDKPAVPATTVTEITPAKDTMIQHTEKKVQASAGTVDTTVRKHEIDVAERRVLLYIAIACGIAGIVLKSMMPAWPALSNGLLVGAVLAGAAWKFAEVPAWLWLAVLAGVGMMVLGYKRAEWDANGDGIPDVLQRRKPDSTGGGTP